MGWWHIVFRLFCSVNCFIDHFTLICSIDMLLLEYASKTQLVVIPSYLKFIYLHCFIAQRLIAAYTDTNWPLVPHQLHLLLAFSMDRFSPFWDTFIFKSMLDKLFFFFFFERYLDSDKTETCFYLASMNLSKLYALHIWLLKFITPFFFFIFHIIAFHFRSSVLTIS